MGFKYIKYTGAFKDLIPLGFEFQKLYAANYRCYHSRKKGNPVFWIWQKGREIEIEDWYDLSAPVIEYLRTYPRKTSCITLVVNKKTLEIHERILNDFALLLSGEEGSIQKYYETFRTIDVVPANLFEKLDLLEGRYEITPCERQE